MTCREDALRRIKRWKPGPSDVSALCESLMENVGFRPDHPTRIVIDRDSEQLVFCPGNSLTKSREFLEDGVGSSGPHEGLGADEVGAGIDLAGRGRRLVARQLGEARDAADWFPLGLLGAGIE
jgi:hypothetical protein